MGYDHCSEGYMQSRPPAIRPALLRFGSSLVWTPSLALALFYFFKIFFTFGSGWVAGQRVSLFDPPHCTFFWDQPLTQRHMAHRTAVLIHFYLHRPTLNKNCQPLVPVLSPLKRKKHSSRGFLTFCGSCWRLEETIPAPWLVWVFKNLVMWLYLWEPQIPCALGRDWMDIFWVVLCGSLGENPKNRVKGMGMGIWLR